MANPTVRQLITASARKLNIVQAGQPLTPDDMDVMLQALDGMIQSWGNNRLMVYNIEEHEFPSTGAASYTLGPGGDFNVERPMAIEYCYARLNNGTAQQLDIANQPLTVGQYAGIAVKNTTSTFGFAFYDDGNYPLRNVRFFPIPAAGNTIVLWLRMPLLDFTNIDAPVTYPPGYERAFTFNLAVEVASEFGKTIPEEVALIAVNSKLEIERLNSVPRFLRGDGGMTRSGRNRYWNWITGNFWQFGNQS